MEQGSDAGLSERANTSSETAELSVQVWWLMCWGPVLPRKSLLLPSLLQAGPVPVTQQWTVSGTRNYVAHRGEHGRYLVHLSPDKEVELCDAKSVHQSGRRRPGQSAVLRHNIEDEMLLPDKHHQRQEQHQKGGEQEVFGSESGRAG